MLEFLDRLAQTERRLDRYLPAPTSRQSEELGPKSEAAEAIPSFVEFVELRLNVRFSPAQRVLVTVAFGGVDPAELPASDREIAWQLFGDVERFPPVTRAVLVAVCGARGGKSYILSALYSLYRALYADLSTMAPGEVAVALVVAPDLGLAHQTLNYAKGAVEANNELRKLVTADNADSLVLRRPDGQPVSILCRAAGRGGGGLRGKSLVSAVLDECAFFRDQSFVINDRDVFNAVAPRVLPGGMVVVASTPWAEAGLLFDEFKLNYGHPITAMAVTAPTLLMLPTQRNIDAVAREESRDPDNAEREFGAQFMTVGAGTFFDRDSCVVDEDAEPATNAVRGARVGVGGDLALVRDAAALVVVHQVNGHFTIAEVVEKKPSRGAPLKLSEVTKEFAAVALRHGADEIEVDHHEIDAAREHLPPGVELVACEGGQQGKVDSYTRFRDLLHNGKIHIPPQYQRLANQLRDVAKKATSGGGMRIYSPHRNNVHGDIVSAAVLAVERAANSPISLGLAQAGNSSVWGDDECRGFG
jgi:hypothetical protein